MLREIDYLRRIADHCRKGAPLDPDLAKWLGTGLDDFLAHRARDVGEALGIRHGRGGVAWWKEEAMRTRDASLRALARGHLAGRSSAAQAKAIRAMAMRYAAGAWRFDEALVEAPASYRSTAKAHLWAAFASGAPMPLSERQLRDILRC